MPSGDVTTHDPNDQDRSPAVRIATWNLEWARPDSPRGRRVAALLDQLADVIVCTECELGSLPNGYIIDAGTDWGYTTKRPDRRKVAVWSRTPWDDVNLHVHPDLPGGRLVTARTTTPIGPLCVAGVCIPWRAAHVSTGRRDRSPWQDHAAFLAHLPEALAGIEDPFVIAGDFNQRIPRTHQPPELAQALEDALGECSVPSAGDTDLGRLIDHVALSKGLRAVAVELLAAEDNDGRLSDHVGAVVTARRVG